MEEIRESVKSGWKFKEETGYSIIPHSAGLIRSCWDSFHRMTTKMNEERLSSKNA